MPQASLISGTSAVVCLPADFLFIISYHSTGFSRFVTVLNTSRHSSVTDEGVSWSPFYFQRLPPPRITRQLISCSASFRSFLAHAARLLRHFLSVLITELAEIE